MPDVSILISSFDGYSECWPAVVHGFAKYWADCPYPIHLMTNFKDFQHPRVQVLRMGADTGWSGRMLKAVEALPTPYVMYFQEDYWIMAPVNTRRVLELAQIVHEQNLHYLRFVANPEPDHDFSPDPGLGIIDAVTGQYRTSVQVSIWRRETLKALLRAEENVWQFELNGTERSRSYGNTFLSVKKRHAAGPPWEDFDNGGIRYLCTAINAGRWFRAAKSYAQAEGLDIDFSTRPMETWWDDFKRSGRLGTAAARVEKNLRLLANAPREAGRRARRRISSR